MGTATTITNKVPDNTITGPGENPEIDNTTKFGDKGTDPATGKPATWDGTKWVEDVDQNQGKQLYDSLIQQGKLKIENNMFANRIKEKGDLTTDQLNMIDSYLLPLGYTRFKQKLDKSYGVKYVWRKK